MKLQSRDFSFGIFVDDSAHNTKFFKVGPLVQIGATTSIQPDGSIYGLNDGYAQTKYILEKMLSSLEEAGACLDDVTEVKMFTADMSRSSEYIKAFSEFFQKIDTTFSLIKSDNMKNRRELIEIEMDAFIDREH